ncbi:type 1 fimbrial protein [Serratia proteamaculans]|uniref:fimbrial protein n=1 Tax=Serratia TaxID=613 RepID=UPI0015754438|nr:type 1 fimbrial protein [Serratia proteamaculans]NTZ28149.1 type 1 fimbrial protein [Serratia proteamaculans]CAI0982193.1 Fimbria A protein precursor [Serratia quinivorans]
MKMKQLVTLMMGLGLAMGTVSVAQAGTVTFKGSIIDAPCSITPETVDQTVNLGQISNVALKKQGKSTAQSFNIKLDKCDVTTLKNVTATFTGAASAGNADLLGITGTAKGASIAITDGASRVIKLGEATKAQKIQKGDNTLAFSAYLQGDPDVTPTGGGTATPVDIVPGEFSSIVDFTLAYQ